MKFPVYRFSEVLRALRNESGLTVLQAAELTGYGNYERWESGETRVGPEYLRTIAQVFGIEGDLWLLAYAWLVDRYTPQPGAGFLDFTPQSIKRVLPRLPRDEVDLGEQANLALRAMGHGQLAPSPLNARSITSSKTGARLWAGCGRGQPSSSSSRPCPVLPSSRSGGPPSSLAALSGHERGRASTRDGRRCGSGHGRSTESGLRGPSDHRRVRRSG